MSGRGWSILFYFCLKVNSCKNGLTLKSGKFEVPKVTLKRVVPKVLTNGNETIILKVSKRTNVEFDTKER